ncbi:tRNA-splicing endonuclease-like protein subunit sen34 [Dendryphion nanum]|uniref:tRNA-splicing endonuclease subunit Sen34 n=1 Tax=Dendryphion nanum TaxID=256645 RepID=A0A9P9D902_9PLEO|nr:tRNA-splicing endonuclease-like protein subunit sen34 [Dendryphion nanum]
MASVTEPFPISRLANRYLLFDLDVIDHVRRSYNMCGVLIGTIPNMSQQNVFLGLPLELMPEEARVLVEQGHAYIVDDAKVHREGFLEMSREDRLKFLQAMDEQGIQRTEISHKRFQERAEKALKAKGLSIEDTSTGAHSEAPAELIADVDDTSVFDSAVPVASMLTPMAKKSYVTPTTSYPPLLKPEPDALVTLPEVPKSYPLYKYVQERGYFCMPGLRFGCHYSIYPGDILRFHSHFLGTGLGWDEEFDLLDIIGGGRLANRNKKAYLIGGEDPSFKKDEESEGNSSSTDAVRVFSIEWSAQG